MHTHPMPDVLERADRMCLIARRKYRWYAWALRMTMLAVVAWLVGVVAA